MRLMYGICIIVTELIDNFVYRLMFSLEDSIADDFLEPRVICMLAWAWHSARRIKGDELQRALLSFIIELIAEKPLDRRIHRPQ